ncbi:uncharacterized protein BJ171DRAFT_540722 [Polychytrium aggregatum]|uniref:uncharacterized protein n=1 Tax=Polychytrium aggregatum TaxID=110093 RepID=UPI0022FE14F7|nr:uncharacterized protein BJ171DRAFT_540722 [Polychytrium aggregatum]KAI9190777.1 hypothetical protein BJ171DRAFT_540722 [Polychytrium aggregatum]
MSSFPRLSRPLSELNSHYDVVVIGSGYGGSISAARFASTGKSVALLERGKERWPGEYPRTLLECTPNIQVTAAGETVGEHTGLFHFYFGDQQNAVVGHGLGGTSLINANVALRADSQVWTQPVWPEDLRNDKEGIDRAFRRAQELLQPEPYPDHIPTPTKLKVLEKQAQHLGVHDHFYRPPVTVAFESRVNNAGIWQPKSTLDGNDCTGENDGSKGTTLMNYIPRAYDYGCEIYCEVKVEYLKYNPETRKWLVFYAGLDADSCTFGTKPLLFVTADVVVLGAGAIGSTEILLRSKAHGLDLSDRVGQQFSGNGDLLAFNYNCNEPVNAIGTTHPTPQAPAGPCITGIIDMRKGERTENDGYVIEDGTIPAALGPLMAPGLKASAIVNHNEPPANSSFLGRQLRELQTTLFGPYTGATLHTETYLVMSHDNSHGEIKLLNDNVQLSFPDVGKTLKVQEIFAQTTDASHSVGGTAVPLPIWSPLANKSLVTVHPLGGCSMAADSTAGVVDSKSRVFKGPSSRSTTAVHEGLYVSDAAVFPMALGVNPFLTISALAERMCEIATKERGWTIDYELPSKTLDFKNPRVPSKNVKRARLRALGVDDKPSFFTSEYLTGRIDLAKATVGESSDSSINVLLLITAHDPATFLDFDNEANTVSGSLQCKALSDDPLLITGGHFQFVFGKEQRGGQAAAFSDSQGLLAESAATAGDSKTILHLEAIDTNGKVYAFEATRETSGLFNAVEDLKVVLKHKGAVVGQGRLSVTWSDLIKTHLLELLDSQKSFLGRLYSAIFGSGPSRTSPTPIFATPSPLLQPANAKRRSPESFKIRASDGVETLLTRHLGGASGPVLLIHGAPFSRSVFESSLLEHSLLDVLLERQHDVFLLDHRLSALLAARFEQHDLDGVASDISSALAKIGEATNGATAHVVAHSSGSLALFMGLLDGRISSSQIKSITSLAGAPYVVPSLSTLLKNQMLYGPNAPALYESVVHAPTLVSSATDALLSWNPFVPLAERCHNPDCERLSIHLGRQWTHSRLSPVVHSHLEEFVDVINLKAAVQLSHIIRNRKLVSATGHGVYISGEVQLAAKLNLPITFIHGSNDVVFLPETSTATQQTLARHNDPSLYRVHIARGYGHSDLLLGDNAFLDVFPAILDTLVRAH